MEGCKTLTQVSSMLDFDLRHSIQTSASQTSPRIFKCFSETVNPARLREQLSKLLYRSFDALREAENVYLRGVNKREHKGRSK